MKWIFFGYNVADPAGFFHEKKLYCRSTKVNTYIIHVLILLISPSDFGAFTATSQEKFSWDADKFYVVNNLL